jgi:hypothetical protein
MSRNVPSVSQCDDRWFAKQIPNKPIRYLINSHQHSDAIASLRAYSHIGATFVTSWHNYDYYRHDIINYVPRTIKPDMVSQWPPTELAEGYTGRRCVRTTRSRIRGA